jgi:hypothetical protein
MRVAGERCPHCGFLPQRPPKPIVFTDGDLALVDRQLRATVSHSDPNERIRWHAMLLHIRDQRGYHSKWSIAKYRERFGNWPPFGANPTPVPPTPEVLSWVRSRNIAYAKAKAAAS